MPRVLTIAVLSTVGLLVGWQVQETSLAGEEAESRREAGFLDSAKGELALVSARHELTRQERDRLSEQRGIFADAPERLAALEKRSAELDKLLRRRDEAKQERERLERLVQSLRRKARQVSRKASSQEASADGAPGVDPSGPATSPAPVPAPRAPQNISMTILFGDYTHAQRVQLNGRYLHKDVRITGAALDLRPADGGGYLLTLGDASKWKWGRYYITCYVEERDARSVRGIQRKGQLVTVVGRLTVWNRKWAVMYKCQLSR